MQIKASFLASAVALCTATTAFGHLGRGVPHDLNARSKVPHDLYKRHRDAGTHPGFARRASSAAPSVSVARTDEASEAKISNQATECTAYSLPEVAAIKAEFPTVWENATIVQGDTEAQSVWAEIQKSGIIPKGISPKGTTKGNFSSFTPTYNKSDPDCWWTFDNCVHPKAAGIAPDVYECPEPDTWGLTYDDGPNCSHNAFYDYLLEQKQKATMFYIGSNVMDWPLEAQRGIVDGHHICVHTWSHQYMTAFPDEQVFAELYYTAKAIKDVVGVTPRCWRPPFGDVDDRVRAIAQGLGLSTVIWTDDTDDWEILPMGTKPTSVIDANYNSIFSKAQAGAYATQGAIVLTHEISNGTMQEAIKMYPTIKQNFKNVVPLTACLNETNPYPEDITFPTFEEYIGGNILASGLPDGTSMKASDASYSPLLAASQTSAAHDSNGGAATASAQAAHDTKGSSGSGAAPRAYVGMLGAGIGAAMVGGAFVLA